MVQRPQRNFRITVRTNPWSGFEAVNEEGIRCAPGAIDMHYTIKLFCGLKARSRSISFSQNDLRFVLYLVDC